MKRIFAILAAAFMALPCGVEAAVTGTPGIAGTYAQPVSVAGMSYANYAGGGSALVVVKSSRGVLGRIINTNTTAQTVTFTCYDSPSAASGTVLWSGILASSQIVDVEIYASNGITCKPSAATLAGNGINVTFW